MTGFPGGIVKFDEQTLAGNTLENRPNLDSWTGSITILGKPFAEQEGLVDQWSVFNDSAAGRSVTPLLLEKSGSDWHVVGVGTTRTIAATGLQTFDFGLVSGSAVAAGRYFGWKDGTAAGVNNDGAIEYSDGTDQTVIQYGFQGAVAPGTVPSDNKVVLNRSYSVQATVLPQPVRYDVGFATIEELSVDLGAGNDNLVLRNQPDTEVASVTLDTGAGSDLVNLPDLAGITVVRLGEGNDEARLHSLRSGTNVQVFGNAGSDTIDITQVGESATTEVTGGLDADLVRVAGGNIPLSATTLLHGTGTDTAPYDVLQYDPAGWLTLPNPPDQVKGTLQAGFYFLNFIPFFGEVAYDTFESVQVIAAPVVSLTGINPISEGESVQLEAFVTPLGSTNSLAEPLAWDIDGDGQFGEVLGTEPVLTWTQLRAFGIDDDGVYQLGARAVNGDGFVTVVYTTLTVNNTVAAINLAGNSSTPVNTAYTVSFSATDPGDDRISEWRIDWNNDGTTDEVLGSSATGATHLYATPGTYTVNVVGVDEDSAGASASLTVTVGVNPEQITAGGPYQITEGDNLSLTATAPGTPSQISWDVNGDDVYGDATGASPTLTWAQLQALPAFIARDKGIINPEIEFSPSVLVSYLTDRSRAQPWKLSAPRQSSRSITRGLPPP